MSRNQILTLSAFLATLMASCLHSPEKEYYEINLSGTWYSADTSETCLGHVSTSYLSMNSTSFTFVKRLTNSGEGMKGTYSRSKELVIMTMDTANGCFEAPCGGGTPFYHACTKPVDTLTIQRNGRLVFRDKEYYRSTN